jgi:hypothetical protein
MSRPARSALAIAIVLAACTPDDADLSFPTAPVSNVAGTSGSQPGNPGGGGSGPTLPDAGALPVGDGGFVTRIDGGVNPFLDAAPPDATALLPDATEVVPPFP